MLNPKEGIRQRQGYKQTVKQLIMLQRFRNHPKNKKKAISAAGKLKTIAGRVVRELKRSINEGQKQKYSDKIETFTKILNQKKSDKEKIYSIHEPKVYCLAKGKDHKKYEFGSKASIITTKNSGIICLLSRPSPTSAIESATKRHRPIGGVIRPIIRLKTTRIPKWVGSTPILTAIGCKMGTNTSIAAIPSRKRPMKRNKIIAAIRNIVFSFI